MEGIKIVEVTPENATKETLFCIKDIKSKGFEDKCNWFSKQHEEGLRIQILKDPDQKMAGFIEYLPAENAWRPVNAPQFMFVHCLMVYPNKNRNKGYASLLLAQAEKEAKSLNMNGLCVMTSKGSWIADKGVFEKNGFRQVDRRGRFELLCKTWTKSKILPTLFDWTRNQDQYKGWNLVYASQCPWHHKSVNALRETAEEFGVDLKIRKFNTPKEAQNGPSGYGVFGLLRDGKLLEDHYLSATRFKSILKKELNLA